MLTQDLLITPARAQAMLERNKLNRPLRHRLVKAYASDIAAGKWQMNGETIKISVDGDLLDGQHRLSAVIDANTPVRMLVIGGLPRDSFHTIDTGMRRSTAQLLAISGKENCSTLAAIGRWLVMLENKTGEGGLRQTQVQPQEVFDALARYPLCAHFAQAHSRKGIRTWLPASAHAVMVLAAEKYGQEVPDSFLASFGSGESLRKGDPVFELRERMIQNKTKVAKLSQNSIVAITIKAVRAYATQRTIGVLRWTPTNEGPVV